MKQLLLLLPFIILLTCCKNNNPDVSGISVEVKIARFDKFLFSRIDTNNMDASIKRMNTEYPSFGKDFMQYILGLPQLPAAGTVYPPLSALGDSALVYNEFKRFLRLTKPVYDSVSPLYNKMSDVEQELKQAFKYVKYYFPAYKIPRVVTYIGPFDTPGVAVTSDALAIGLQLFAGKNFSFYTSTDGQELYPMYISRRFERQYIAPNCMKAVIEDLYPDRSSSKSLIVQMIEKGKRWYAVNKFLPDAPDSLITDYTGEQVKWVNSNEGLIWNFLMQGTDIYTTDPAIIKNFIGEAPSTNGMPPASPGNIGQWVGWQIVNAYARKHAELTPEALMKLDAKTIFTEARYKPK